MRRVLAVIGVGAALAFGACGGGDDEAPPTSGAGEATESQGTPEPQPTEERQEGQQQQEEGGATPTAAEAKQTFTTTCGGCHVLEKAGTNGQVGPNLDDLKLDEQRVLSAIEEGPSAMPDNLLQGAEAEAVAAYVAKAAGS